MRALDFEAAIPLLRKVAQGSSLPAGERALAELDLGISFVNVGRDDDARKAFARALRLDPKTELPGEVSPKIKGLFEEARAQVAPAAPPQPEAAAPPVEPPVPPVLQPAPAAPPPAPPAPIAATETPSPARSRSLAAPIALEALAAVGLGVGIWSGLESANAAHSLQASLNPRSTVDGLVSQTGTYAVVSIVSYVVAGLAAATGVTVYALEGRTSSSDADKQVSSKAAAPSPFAFSF
ncbi:MAG: tetratricopeptide repeat protein [Myxococcales bacterium]